MEAETRTLHAWKVIAPQERRLDAFVEKEFKKLLWDSVSDGTQQLIVDLSAVDFVDSSGLGALVSCRRVLGKDGHMVLTGARPGVAATLSLTRLDRVFTLLEVPEQVLELSL